MDDMVFVSDFARNFDTTELLDSPPLEPMASVVLIPARDLLQTNVQNAVPRAQLSPMLHAIQPPTSASSLRRSVGTPMVGVEDWSPMETRSGQRASGSAAYVPYTPGTSASYRTIFPSTTLFPAPRWATPGIFVPQRLPSLLPVSVSTSAPDGSSEDLVPSTWSSARSMSVDSQCLISPTWPTMPRICSTPASAPPVWSPPPSEPPTSTVTSLSSFPYSSEKQSEHGQHVRDEGPAELSGSWAMNCIPEQEFATPEDAHRAMNKYASGRGYAMVYKSTSYDHAKSRRVVQYGCDRHGKRREHNNPSSVHRRPNVRSRRCGCPISVFVVRKQLGAGDTVWEPQHRGRATSHNHPPSTSVASYPILRRLSRSASVRGAIKVDGETRTTASQIIARLLVEDPSLAITSRDVYNERQRATVLALGGMSRMEFLLE
jgi:hypothetical protein